MNISSVEEHRREAPQQVSCMVVTVSDTRTVETDTGGRLLVDLLETNGYQVARYVIVKDDYDGIRQLVSEAAERDDIEAVLLTGGTGISPRDTTYEAVSSLLDKELPGFGGNLPLFKLCRGYWFCSDIESCCSWHCRPDSRIFYARLTWSRPFGDGAHYYT